REATMSQTSQTARRVGALSAEERRLTLARPRRRLVLRRFLENRLAVAGLAVIVLFYAVAIVAPAISRYDPNVQSPGQRSKPPSAQHWLGTDRNLRDTYARLIIGRRGWCAGSSWRSGTRSSSPPRARAARRPRG